MDLLQQMKFGGLKMDNVSTGSLIESKKNEVKYTYLTYVKNQVLKYKYVYIMLAPVMLYFILFQYLPMFGVILAFKNYSIRYDLWTNLFHTPFIGFKHFIDFFNGIYFQRVFFNTIILNFYGLIFNFPAPIILALLLNELRSPCYKKTIQTITYMPHFISLVVVCGLVIDFTSSSGFINTLIEMAGGSKVQFITESDWFRPIYVISGIWQEVGWGSIIYLAALAGIDAELYEAAVIDGAGRFRQLFYITIPCLMPTIVILLILRVGQMMNIGVEKILLLYLPTTYETSDVISSYVYRRGLLEMQYSFTTAVGLFNSIINFTLLIAMNKLSKKATESSLW